MEIASVNVELNLTFRLHMKGCSDRILPIITRMIGKKHDHIDHPNAPFNARLRSPYCCLWYASERAYRQLIAAFPTWEQVRDAPTHQIAEAIKSGGLANVKSVRIQDVLHTLTEQQQEQGGTKTLAEYLFDELAKRRTEDAWHYLRKLPGVGPKTAACVLMFNLDRASMPVDTHVHRTSQRLGLIGPKVTADQAHVLFAKVTPPEWVYPLHVNLITHGRQICHAQRPECARCPLYSVCAYVGSVIAQETAIPSW